MPKYVVVNDFADIEDERYIYRVGDKFPRHGRAKKARIKELASDENKLGKPVIEEVVEEVVEEEVDA